MSGRVDPSILENAMAATESIRNFCILAHVDHGKTTLSDSLVCSNGLFSQKLAGKLRFLDSTEEEQKRGITMQSSAISLLYRQQQPNAQSQEDRAYLMNLIDSPGHIDFSSDVSTATRLCDGALILVDVLEGVCTQTHAVVYKALKERMRPCLVLNKLDRMILEMKLSPAEAFQHLKRIVENINALAYSLVVAELRSSSDSTDGENNVDLGHPLFAEWTFAPEKANVVFISALDCWGFGLIKFANIWAKRLDINKGVLQKYLFEDYAYHPAEKKLVPCDPSKPHIVPMFVKMILEPIWQLYDIAVIQGDSGKAAKMAARALGVEVTPREVSAKDPRVTLSLIMNKWLPLPDAILRMVVRCMPGPVEAQQQRLHTLLPSKVSEDHADTACPQVESVVTDIASCSTSREAEVVVFVSKMVPVRIAELTPVDRAMLERRKEAREGLEEGSFSYDANAEVLMALSRVFSGILTKDTTLHVLGSRAVARHLVAKERVPSVAGGQLGFYLCLGPSVSPMKEIHAGNIAGIIGLEEAVLKTATLASTTFMPPLRPISFQAQPMLRVALEPVHHQDLPRLDAGLQMLYQFDPVVEVEVQDSGEHTMTCLGELHLELCLKMLMEKFSGCEIRASQPLVVFRETLVPTCISAPGKAERKAKIKGVSGQVGLRNSEILCPPWSDMAHLNQAEGGSYSMSSTSGEVQAEWQSYTLPKTARLCLQKRTAVLKHVGEWLSANHVHGAEDKKDSAGGSATTVFQLKNEDDASTLWRQAAPTSLSLGWSSVVREILFGAEEEQNSEAHNNDDNDIEKDEKDEDDEGAEHRLRSLFPYLKSESSDIEAEATALLNHTLALGPRGVMSNGLFLGADMSIRIWPGRPPSTAVGDNEVDGAAEGQHLLEQKPCAVVSYATHPTLFKRIYGRLHSAVSTGFHMAVSTGPLMHEPVDCVFFALQTLDMSTACALGTDVSLSDLAALSPEMERVCSHAVASLATFSGQLISDTVDALHLCMLSCVDALRLVEPVYSCSLQCDTQQVGNLYSVLSKRRGVVQEEDVIDGTTIFILQVHLPVIESFGFSSELLKKTSGMATAPQLEFSHWQVRDTDPFWRPTSQEELEDHGELASEPNDSKRVIEMVRRRKGLPVEEKIVAFAEKQRTLNKKK